MKPSLPLFCALALSLGVLACSEKKKEHDHADHVHADGTHHDHAAAEPGLPSAAYADSVNRGLIAPDTVKSSPIRQAMATVGGNHVHIRYGSPGVRERVIWGGLVPYGEVWVTGAHNATSVAFGKDTEIGGKLIPKGEYAFFTIPGKTDWTVIFNKNVEQHLADEYAQKDDVLRLTVKPVFGDSLTQRLTYAVTKTGDNQGTITLRWEKVAIAVPFKTTNTL